VVFYYKDQPFVLIYKIGKGTIMKKLFLGLILGLGLSTMTFAELIQDRIGQLSQNLAVGAYSDGNNIDVSTSLKSNTIENAFDEFYPIAQKYVNTEKINIRNAPVDGKIIGHLNRGKLVLIYDREGTWERISSEKESPKWLSSTLLCSGGGCYINSLQSSHSSYSTKGARNTYKSSKKIKPSVSLYGGSCPCSEATNCVGPRGGIYCITSGGNKRYR